MAGEKKGRPALPGERYPSGERKPPRGDVANENIFRRLVEIGESVGLDPRMTSQIGRLRWIRAITDSQAAAADKIARVYARFEKLHGTKRLTRSPSYEFSTAGERELVVKVDGEWRRPGDPEFDDWAATIEREYAAVQACIPVTPREARETVEALCCEDRAVHTTLLPDLRIVLDRVAEEFGLVEAPVAIEEPPQRRRRRGDANPPRFRGRVHHVAPPTAPGTPDPPPKPTRASRQARFEEGLFATLKVGRLSGEHAPAPMTDAEAAEISVRNLAQEAAAS